MSRKSQNQESPPSVPAYIVTFSDMVTLLLTFFVLLISLAQVRDPELFHKGRDAFVQHINTMGMGLLFGQKMAPDFDAAKVKYYIANPDENPEVRTINAKEEGIRRIFKDITRSMTAMPSQIVAQKTHFLVTNIGFSRGKALLSESAKQFLTQFAMDLPQKANQEETKLYVLGLANDEQNAKKQWILSARRAQAVADFLTHILPSEHHYSVYSWGAGPGGCWVDEGSSVSRQSQILIAVLNEND